MFVGAAGDPSFSDGSRVHIPGSRASVDGVSALVRLSSGTGLPFVRAPHDRAGHIFWSWGDDALDGHGGLAWCPRAGDILRGADVGHDALAGRVVFSLRYVYYDSAPEGGCAESPRPLLSGEDSQVHFPSPPLYSYYFACQDSSSPGRDSPLELAPTKRLLVSTADPTFLGTSSSASGRIPPIPRRHQRMRSRWGGSASPTWRAAPEAVPSTSFAAAGEVPEQPVMVAEVEAPE